MKRLKVLSPIFFIALWQGLCSAGWLPVRTPSPVDVAKGLYELFNTGIPPGYALSNHILESLGRVFLGFTSAVVVAVPLGVMIGYFPWAEMVFDPLVELARPIPPLAWLPLAVLWFGIGISSAAFLIFLGSFFPVVLNTVSGVKSCESYLIDASKTLGAGRGTILARVIIPQAFPSIATGLRIGMGVGWMTLVAAEMTGVRSGYGLGYMILTARDLARYDLVVAGIVVIGVIGFLIDLGFRSVEKRLLLWR